MIVVGDNLRQLILQHNIIRQDKRNIDENCIKLSLGDTIKRIEPTDKIKELNYEETLNPEIIKSVDISATGLTLQPKECVLACSKEDIYIPQGYFGLMQTAGSLARYFVSCHFSDAQIDTGFSGKVTFEFFNASNFRIKFRVGQEVANLYILKTTTKSAQPYEGRYQNAKCPTHFIMRP